MEHFKNMEEGFMGLGDFKYIHGPKKGQESLIQSLEAFGTGQVFPRISAEQCYTEKDMTYLGAP